MSGNSSILHELYVFSEWKPEPEYLQKPDNILPESLSALWRWLNFFGAKKSLIDSVNAYKKKLQKWQIALGDEGKVIAVVTDNILEIRTKRSEYATIAARTTVARDPYSQWRKVVWSPDCSFIALAYGNGIVSFFDLTASNLFNIPFECSRPGGLECTDTTHAVAAIIFMPLRVKDPKWNWEVLIVSFDGLLRSFLVSLTDGFKLHNSFRFKGGVGAVAYCQPHNMLYVAGVPHRPLKDSESPLGAGLRAWRTLNDEPYYKLSVVSDELESQLANNAYQLYIPFVTSNSADFVIRMEVSADGAQLVCLHCGGDVSLWALPALRLRRRHRLPEQPGHDRRGPLRPPRAPDADAALFCPIDVDWWSNQEIILSRQSGAVTICRTEDMVNILGQQPEFLQGAPQITRAYDGTFMALECESTVLPAKGSPSDESVEGAGAEAEREGEPSALRALRELARRALFALTDLEAFQPRPRRVTVVARVYRLLAVRSTTPDDLFARQIEGGRYREALALAATYGLDSDLVYQQQWRKNPVSTDAIQQYLSKVAKKIWAVHQCVDRLPESLPAARELLHFGLRLTNEKILEEINKDRAEDEHISLEEVTPGDLNAYTGELLRCRHVMLFYRQRLALYEAILRAEKSSYTKDEYHRLRSNKLVHSASEIAQEGRIEALTCLWPHLRTVRAQLAALDSLPETVDPLRYQHLLPAAREHDWFDRKSPIKVKPVEDENDWCKKEMFRSIWSSNWSEDSTPEGEGAAGAADAAAWYRRRAREVERRSGLVSHALALLRLGAAGGAQGLDDLTFHLLTLDTLVYDVNLEDVTLERLERLPVDDVCRLLMTNATAETFVSELQRYVVPYLRRLAARAGGPRCERALADYLTGLSVDDLTYILLVVQAKDEFDMTMEVLLELVEECLLAHTGTDQLDLACELLNTVLKECSGSGLASAAVRRVGALERLVAGSSRLAWRGVRVPLAALRERAADPRHAAHLLTALARTPPAGKEKPNQQDWENLLKDILDLQSIVFDCLSVDKCYEIYALALMTSGDAASIRLAGEVLTRVPPARAARLALDAAREYVNSASSLTDPALDHARCCLDLVQEKNPEIEEELDLIAAMKILNSFNLEMLPVQVRLCDNRLELIERCVSSEPGAHLASQRLLRLAALLRVAGDDDQLREGLVLQPVCEAALAAGAAGEAAGAAARLAALRHAPAAALLARVAAQPAPADTAARLALLAAALAHAHPRCIEDHLRTRLRLQVEGMQAAGRGRAQRWPSTEEEFCDAITTPVIENKDLVAPPDQEKKVPLFNYLLDTFQNKFSLSGEKPAGGEPAEREVHCQEFYQSLYPEHRVSDAHYRYSRFARPDERDPHAALLHWYYTQNCLDDTMNELETEVMQRCGYGWVYADTALGVACLARAARGPAPPPPPPPPAAPPAAAAALYATLLQCAAPELKDDVYLTPPKQMAQLTLSKRLASPEQLAQIGACLARLSDAGDVLRLRALGLPVSAPLFLADDDYRRELVYRLARSESAEQYSLAMRLARKHALDEVAVWLQHAGARLAPHDLPDAVRAPTAYPRIRDALWAGLAGTDHGGLIAYFTILRSIDDKPLLHGLSAADHIKLLKKAKAASPELDYKLVVEQAGEGQAGEGQERLVQHVLGIVRPETVGLLTKFLRTLPPPLRALPANQIYVDWLTNYFFSVGNTGGGAGSRKWMQQYRQCASYFNKLAKDDLLRFVENVCFTPDALARVPSGTRSLMIMQAVDYCQQEQENDFKFNKNEQSWAAVGQELTRWARFLENFHSDAVRAIRDAAPDVQHDHAWRSLEMSHGSARGVLDAGAALALGGLRAAALASLLHCLHADAEPPDVLEHALDHHLHDLQDMQTFASRLVQYHREGVEVRASAVQRALERARALGLPAHRQLPLLALAGGAAPPDLRHVAASTVDLFRDQWPEHADDIDEEMMSSEEGRSGVFERFVERCDSWPRSKALADALGCWPPTPTRWGRSALCEFLRRQLRAAPDALLLIRLLLRRPALPAEEVKWLAESAEECAVVNALWIVLLSKCEHSDELVIDLLQRHKDAILKLKIENDMIKELLDQGMFIKLVGSPLYAAVVNYVTGEPAAPYDVQWAARELLAARHVAEAGHLQLLAAGVPSSLRGFTQTVLYNKKKV